MSYLRVVVLPEMIRGSIVSRLQNIMILKNGEVKKEFGGFF